MDHTGETGDQIETEAELEAVLVDDEPVEHDEIEVEAEAGDDDVETAAALDAEAAAAEDAAAEGSDDDERVDESEDSDDDDDESGDSEAADVDAEDAPRDGARHRHPTAAAALAKRVAMDRSARIAVGSLVAVAMMFLFVFPTRSYIAQQGQVRDARNSVQELRLQNEKLAREAERLQTPTEIQKLARSQFNMVLPGEEAYNVVPPDGAPTTTTAPG